MLRTWGGEEQRGEDFQRALSLQKAPSLADLESIIEAAQRIVSTPEVLERSQSESAAAAFRADAKQIFAGASHLPSVEIPRNRRIPSRERAAIQVYVAEKLTARAFAASQLTDYHDWRSLFAAYSSITTRDLNKALEP
jgi:hypothetical protein